MEKVIKLKAIRDSYEIKDVLDDALTAEELIEVLRNYPKDSKVVMSFDNNYMWGGLRADMFNILSVETREEEDERRFLQECEDKIYDLEFTEYEGDGMMEQTLSSILGEKVRCYDSGIDDGVDNDEEDGDKYVMKSCFNGKVCGKDFYVRVYYGDVTREIGCIEIDY